MNLSKSLRVAIAINGVRHKDLAKALGCRTQIISGWIKSGRISRTYLIAISEYFEMTVSEFIALGE